jgi:hypothetical protein
VGAVDSKREWWTRQWRRGDVSDDEEQAEIPAIYIDSGFWGGFEKHIHTHFEKIV